MNWEGCGRKLSWYNLWYYPEIPLEGLRKTTKYIGADRRCPGRDSYWASLKYKLEAFIA
jgi:hypothetical protein